MRIHKPAWSAAFLVGCIITGAAMAPTAFATLLAYEPFDYPDATLNGQGGAPGTTGTWTTNDTGFAQGWWCHPEGELTGQFDDLGGGLNMFDGTVDNLPTTGGFVGSAGPEEQGAASGTRVPTGNMDANIGLDPSVTATFQSGTTTWFSYVGAHADNRNQGSPTLMLCTDPTVDGARGLTMQNSGSGIGGVGGPTRFNLQDVYPHYFSDGIHHQTPGGYLSGAFGGHDGIVTAFCSTATCDGVLDESGQERTQTMAWQISDDNGFGAPNIVVGKIEWDADVGGEDVISVARFLETDTLDEAAFDALIDALPALSSRNWESNKPDLDQSQFDTLNISSLKFFIDEIRIATTFSDALGGGIAAAPPFAITEIIHAPDTDMVTLTWRSREGRTYAVKVSTDLSNWDADLDDGVEADLGESTTRTFDISGLAADGKLYFRVERQ